MLAAEAAMVKVETVQVMVRVVMRMVVRMVVG